MLSAASAAGSIAATIDNSREALDEQGNKPGTPRNAGRNCLIQMTHGEK
jgi:hypothetical protein